MLDDILVHGEVGNRHPPGPGRDARGPGGGGRRVVVGHTGGRRRAWVIWGVNPSPGDAALHKGDSRGGVDHCAVATDGHPLLDEGEPLTRACDVGGYLGQEAVKVSGVLVTSDGVAIDVGEDGGLDGLLFGVVR